nr:NF-kappa B 65-kD subunit [human, Peptide Partial, 10 aa] [Homo sapiens]
QISQASALAP